MSDLVRRPDGRPYWTLSCDFPDLDAIHADAIADGGPAAEELAPGVTRAEADAAMLHAVIVQHGFTTSENEAQRIAKDRARVARARAQLGLSEAQ